MKMVRWLYLLIAATVLLLTSPAHALAVAWSFDSVTYTPPPGFSPIVGGPADRADWKRIDGNQYCEIAVFWAADATQNPLADHAKQWARLADTLFHTGAGSQPASGALPSGAQMWASVGAGQWNGSPVGVALFTIRGAGRVTPILILTPTAEAFKNYSPAIHSFTASLIAHAAWQRPANLPSEPLNLKISDLAGTWQLGSANMITFVNSSGSVVGGNATFFNQIETVAPDGRYESSMSGMTGGSIVREKITGTWSLDGEFLVVTQSGHSTKRLRLALLLDGPNATVIGLAPPDRPVSLSSISGTGEYWSRKKTK